MLEWFRPGEHDRVDRVLADLATLGVTELRTGVSWADACTPEGEDWYAWLLPQLARRVEQVARAWRLLAMKRLSLPMPRRVP
jgi:CDP-paratose 2-epimerase